MIRLRAGRVALLAQPKRSDARKLGPRELAHTGPSQPVRNLLESMQQKRGLGIQRCACSERNVLALSALQPVPCTQTVGLAQAYVDEQQAQLAAGFELE